MNTKTQLRTVMVLNDELQWVNIEMEDLKKDDIFRMFELDKTPVWTPVWGQDELEGVRTFIATEDAEMKKGCGVGVMSNGVKDLDCDRETYTDMDGVEYIYNGRKIGEKK